VSIPVAEKARQIVGVLVNSEIRFLRRKEAAAYLRAKYGFGAERTLAKGAVTGDTPAYQKAGKIVLYTLEALDAWAMSKIGPVRRSTSDSTAR
jgi:hypothetical protein